MRCHISIPVLNQSRVMFYLLGQFTHNLLMLNSFKLSQEAQQMHQDSMYSTPTITWMEPLTTTSLYALCKKESPSRYSSRQLR